ncbi:prepilin-type N-terminal cleavage/methylation domain-containing protein [Microvenator marinus]|jgi:general secretion pathway protein G|uniref:Prepilin-type N-terminal cleavage/methylation domain-containing protein n=1 Tax=Microvenator marinus TaxID=2600177 RepID=A0A5B8XN44_9DELT|nr:type II secretion system protein GspG [Microvenator marinus]QED27262.1 prepilin-type N-terminal cleavage/methylation domain-containing protein [Microvenator marinus]
MLEQKKIRKTSLRRTLAEARGMTIVELMIVLTIIASIMGVVGFYVFGAIDRANVKEAQIEIANLTQMVESYYLTSDPKQFPNELEDLAKGPSKLTEKVPQDPWGQPYIYKKTGTRDFEIYSVGADGVEGNEDDVRAAGK